MQRKISAEEKAKVALVAMQGNLTQAEMYRSMEYIRLKLIDGRNKQYLV